MAENSKYPKRGEMVIATVIRVNPFSAVVRLDEYNKEGMIHVSEVSRRWIKDIKKAVKPGQKLVPIVMRVDRQKGHINLSLKRVNKYDADEKLKQYKREQKADRMLRMFAKRSKMDLEEAYEKIGYKLKDEFGEIFKAFQLAASEGEKIFTEKGISDKHAKLLAEISKDQLETKELKMKKIISVKSFSPEGISLIRQALEEAEDKFGVDIKYISAPDYSISLRTKDAKQGDKTISEAAEYIREKICSQGGQCEVKGD